YPDAAANGASSAAAVPDLNDETQVLRWLAEGMARSTGEAFFRSLVRNLSLAIGSAYCVAAEFLETEQRARTLAVWGRGQFLDNVEYPLAGTACAQVLVEGFCHYPHGVQEKFPNDLGLREMRVESYLSL